MTSHTPPPENSNVRPLFADTSGQDKHPIIDHYFNFFSPCVARTEAQKSAIDTERDLVCQRTPSSRAGQGNDADIQIHYCYVRHFPTALIAGSIKLIQPNRRDILLPLECSAADTADDWSLDMRQLDKTQCCEFSRIVIPETFRRRDMDQHAGAEFGVINQQSYSDQELRCFPLIVISLYLSAIALARQYKIRHGFALLDDNMSSSLKFMGIQSEAIGPTIRQQGLRTPHYFDFRNINQLSEAHFALLASIDEALSQCESEI